MSSSDLVAIPLTDEDLAVLHRGLVQWLGPTRPTDDLARAMGFADRDGLVLGVELLASRLERHEASRPEVWRQVVIAVEICFVSDVFGAGVEWASVTGSSSLAVVVGLA